MSSNNPVTDRVFWLRHDDAFDDLLVEAIRKEPSLNKLVVQGKLDTEDVREFALRAIEGALLRFADAELELPNDGRYSDQLEKTFKKLGLRMDAHHEHQELWRSVFRFAHAALKSQLSEEEAWRTFALASSQIIEAIAELQAALWPLVNVEGEEET